VRETGRKQKWCEWGEGLVGYRFTALLFRCLFYGLGSGRKLRSTMKWREGRRRTGRGKKDERKEFTAPWAEDLEREQLNA
jgi:hypothetical protein